uniref:Extended FMRFamide-12 n=3 Tax=Austrophasmatidae TaxID=409164 RepID=FAR12_HEMMO|nr:RecName: Full=Extended FMRFamide-12; Short=FMRFa-12 [Striatophasma naukluftense]B3A071.1 RecName: Full=Extended FMRFamide-12; Short=FMRFa-12 [Karoophasma biedouwense]B3A0C9.1 RecName: Full=Extended FMRFamide-12; Short=FMRFa-12 [Hemilobophasma montaguense]
SPALDDEHNDNFLRL